MSLSLLAEGVHGGLCSVRCMFSLDKESFAMVSNDAFKQEKDDSKFFWPAKRTSTTLDFSGESQPHSGSHRLCLKQNLFQCK